MLFNMDTAVLCWGAALIVFAAAELATVGLITIWFAIGALCALIAALLGAPPWLQILWFALISVTLLLLTRPLARKYINSRTQPTNADRLIGTEAVVREAVDNLGGRGAVYAGGKVWTARSEAGEPIPAGATVVIRGIEGVKLIVSPHRGAQ